MKFHIFTNIRFAVCKFYIVQLLVNSQVDGEGDVVSVITV